MTPVHVTAHAARRWIERIQPSATMIEAIAAIRAHATAIETAFAFGAPVVRLGNGAKLVLRDGVVATVYPRRWIVNPMGGRL